MGICDAGCSAGGQLLACSKSAGRADGGRDVEARGTRRRGGGTKYSRRVVQTSAYQSLTRNQAGLCCVLPTALGPLCMQCIKSGKVTGTRYFVIAAPMHGSVQVFCTGPGNRMGPVWSSQPVQDALAAQQTHANGEGEALEHYRFAIQTDTMDALVHAQIQIAQAIARLLRGNSHVCLTVRNFWCLCRHAHSRGPRTHSRRGLWATKLYATDATEKKRKQDAKRQARTQAAKRQARKRLQRRRRAANRDEDEDED